MSSESTDNKTENKEIVHPVIIYGLAGFGTLVLLFLIIKTILLYIAVDEMDYFDLLTHVLDSFFKLVAFAVILILGFFCLKGVLFLSDCRRN